MRELVFLPFIYGLERRAIITLWNVFIKDGMTFHCPCHKEEGTHGSRIQSPLGSCEKQTCEIILPNCTLWCPGISIARGARKRVYFVLNQ